MVLHFPANIKSQDGAACCVLRCSVKQTYICNKHSIYLYIFLASSFLYI